MKRLFISVCFFTNLLSLQVFSQTPEWDNPKVVQVNELNPHAGFFHYPNLPMASKFDKSSSSWMLMLNGNWQFNHVSVPSERHLEFPLPNFDASKWEIVHVPAINKPDKFVTSASFPNVTNENNPVNSYRKIFPVPENWYGQQIIIRFNGAGSGFYVWLNGKRVGYSETGNCGSEFNITSYVKFGRMNTLAVQTYALTDDSWFNSNDSVPNFGIFGDVYIYSVPNLSISDFKVDADVVSNSGQLKVSVIPKKYLQSINGKFKLTFNLKDNDGKDVMAPVTKIFSSTKKADSVVVFKQQIAQIKYWDPGEPCLYSLLIELKDKEDQTIEVVGAKIGFRNISFKDNAILINGSAVISDNSKIQSLPFINSYEQLLKVISNLKETKNYVVSTGNSVIDPNMLSLFDSNGICVIENIPFEIDEKNSTTIGEGIDWKEHIIDRVKKIIARDKNHPCVISFKIDENLKGPNFNTARKLLE